MEKRKLAKLAVAALVVASALPAGVQADDQARVGETLLAMAACGSGCGGSGAARRNNNVSYNPSNQYDAYNARTNSYQADNSDYNNRNRFSSTTSTYDPGSTSPSNISDTSSQYNTNRSYGSDASGQYNTNRGYSTSPNYSDMSPSANANRTGTGSNYGTGNYGAGNNNYGSTNPGYATGATGYDSDTSTGSGMSSYGGSNSSYNNYGSGSYDTTSAGSLTEADLLKQLNSQGRAIYQSLDDQGKALALKLANQDTYKDKNQAVKEAQRQMNSAGRTSTTTGTTGGSYNSF
jgi:hypothetical protein